MKLPISLLVLAALSHASPQTPATSSEQKDSAPTNNIDFSQASKRELIEGNFGDRKREVLSNYVGTDVSSRIEYAEGLKEEPNQSPAHQIFGARLPQISKISDVLTGQGPSFEVAVANHLYAPMSVYQARLSSPTLFEVPTPAASQAAYLNADVYKPRKLPEDDQKLQELPTKETKQPPLNLNNIPVFPMKQPKFNFGTNPRPFGFPPQQSRLPQNVFHQLQRFPKKPTFQPFLIYDESGPNRYPGQVLPTQYLRQQGIFQLFPIDPGFDYVNQEENRGEKGYTNHQESPEEIKSEPTEKPKVQKETYVPEQAYHAHPNGAISFASYSQSIPIRSDQETTPQPHPENPSIQEQQVKLYTLPFQTHLLEQKLQPVNHEPQYPSIFQQYVKQLEKYRSDFHQQSQVQPQPGPQPEAHFVNVQRPIQNPPSQLNPLQRFIFEDPRRLVQATQFQGVSPIKPLLQSPQTLFQPTTTSSIIHRPIPQFKPLPEPFGYRLSTQNPVHIHQPLAPILPQRHLNPLPSFQPNFSQSANPHTHTSPAFLPTTLQPLPITAPKAPASDQLVSSTTIQPETKNHQEHTVDLKNVEIQQQNPSSQPLEPKLNHQSQPTELPLSIQSTTLQPIVAYEPQSEYIQYSTPRPEYLSTIHPQLIKTSPRHEVVIQQQEVQELILEPSHLLSSTPHYQPQLPQNQGLQQEQEAHQLQTQQQQSELEQLQIQHHQQELQELQSRQRAQQQKQLKQNALQKNTEKNLGKTQQTEQNLELQLVSTPEPTPQTEKPEQEGQPNSGLELQSNTEKPLMVTSEPQSPEKSHSPSEPKHYTSGSEDPFTGQILSHIQTATPQIYTQPQELLIHREFGSPLGEPPFPDVQYFGTFAESIFGSGPH